MKCFFTFFFLLISTFSFTQNITDSRGLKQGLWIVESIDTLVSVQVSLLTMKEDTMVEYKNYNRLEGQYVDGLKMGVWISRNSYNNILSTVTYEDDKPYGEVIVYYLNRKSIRYKGSIKENSQTVELDTKAIAGKYWSTITMNVDELIEKWTMINTL